MSITIRKPAKSPGLVAPYGSPKLQSEALPVFTFPETGQTLRVFELEGNPWFVGADVLTLLYGAANGQGHRYDKLAKDEVTKVPRKHLGLGGGKDMVLISESGLYKLIMRSDKLVARKFQDWVTREVLPAIRRKGGYVMGEEKLRTGEMSREEFWARALVVVSGTNTRRRLGGGQLIMGGARGGS